MKLLDKPLNLAFCTDGIFPDKVGGMQRHSRLLVEELVKYSNLNITVYHPHEKEVFKKSGNLTEVLIPEIDIDKNYLKECKNYSERIYNELIKGEFDVIYSQGLAVWFKMEEFTDKLIVNPHGLEPFQAIGLKNKAIAVIYKRVFKSIFKKAKHVVSLGGMLTDILNKNVDPKKIVVLPNATNLPQKISTHQFPDTKQPLKMMFVSRFAQNKGIHILIDVIKKLNDAGYEDSMFFNLAGKGPLYEHYKTNFNFKNIKYWGFISDEDLNSLYASSDCFVFPTLFEGMPTVVLEAMSNKLPIIVTNVGATVELVDKSNGYLIKRDNREVLEKAILDFFGLSKEDKAVLSRNSHQKVKENFTWERVAERHIELFEDVVSR